MKYFVWNHNIDTICILYIRLNVLWRILSCPAMCETSMCAEMSYAPQVLNKEGFSNGICLFEYKHGGYLFPSENESYEKKAFRKVKEK